MDYDKLKPKVTAVRAEHADWTKTQVAGACNAKTIVEAYDRWVSFRTLAAVLTEAEYTTARTILDGAAQASRRAADMVAMLETPGDESGSGGGINFGCVAVREQIAVLFAAHEVIRGKLMGMAERLISWATSEHLDVVTDHHIERADEMLAQEA